MERDPGDSSDELISCKKSISRATRRVAGCIYSEQAPFPIAKMPRDSRLLAALRATLLQMENSTEVSPDDSALVALKSILLRRIADLEAEEAAIAEPERAPDESMRPSSPPEKRLPRLR